MTTALIIVDHGSKREAANDMLWEVVALLKSRRPQLMVKGAHMELCAPDIPSVIQNCIENGATQLIIQPFMLSPGRHSTEDIPNITAAAMASYPKIPFTVTEHFGEHHLITDIIFEKTGL